MTRRLLAGLALAGATAFLVAGCSSTDTIFPAVHDIPAPRPDAPLTAEEVKQATDSLITERDHLSTEMQTAARPAPGAKTATKTDAKTDTKTAANTKAGTPKKPPAVPRATAVGPAGADGTLTAGAETKP